MAKCFVHEERFERLPKFTDVSDNPRRVTSDFSAPKCESLNFTRLSSLLLK